MREKKSWKTIDHSEVLATLETQNRQKEIDRKQSSLKNEELFKINVDKKGLQVKREKLRKDRFLTKDRPSSKVEVELLKRIAIKNENKKSRSQGPSKRDEDVEVLDDLWNDDNSKSSRNISRFRNYIDKTQTKVKQVVLPMGGQSYNPSAKDHKEVIQKVVEEELKEVAKAQRILKTLKPYLFKDQTKVDEVDQAAKEQDEKDQNDSDAEEIRNKPVDRGNKLTKTQRNSKLQKKQNRENQDKAVVDKNWNKQFNKIPLIVNEYQQRGKEIQQNVDKKHKEIKDEKDQQESTGIIGKSSVIGRYKYRMRKTDFQTEDEFAGSFRTIRVKGAPADLLIERYDSIYRRNLIEPEAQINGDKKRNKKSKFKWHKKGGRVAEKLNEINLAEKLKIEKKRGGKKSLLKDDLILI